MHILGNIAGFALIFITGIVGVYAPAGFWIWMIGKKPTTYRRLWQAIAIVGGIALWFILQYELPFPKNVAISLWKISGLLIAFGWSLYLFAMGLTFGFAPMPKSEDPTPQPQPDVAQS